MTRPFRLIDVFGTDPLTGNPLAVIADAEGLTTDEMQAIASWLNFSETTRIRSICSPPWFAPIFIPQAIRRKSPTFLAKT